MTVKELRESLVGLPDDMPVFRNDAEWGPQAVQCARVTKVQNDPDSGYHWEKLYEDPDTVYLDVLLLGYK